MNEVNIRKEDEFIDDTIKNYIIDIRCFEDTTLFRQGIEILPNSGLWLERKDSINRYRKKEDKYRSLGAGLLLFYILNKYKISNIDLCKNTYGKLMLVNHVSFHFNLSHSGDYAVCSVGNMENGIDIEQWSSGNEDISKRFFCEQEHQMVKTYGGDMFTRIWTLKESYIKAVGKGLSIPLNSFELHPGIVKEKKQLWKQALQANTPTYMESDRNVLFQEFSIEGYHVSVCSKGSISDQLILIDFADIVQMCVE